MQTLSKIQRYSLQEKKIQKLIYRKKKVDSQSNLEKKNNVGCITIPDLKL